MLGFFSQRQTRLSLINKEIQKATRILCAIAHNFLYYIIIYNQRYLSLLGSSPLLALFLTKFCFLFYGIVDTINVEFTSFVRDTMIKDIWQYLIMNNSNFGRKKSIHLLQRWCDLLTLLVFLFKISKRQLLFSQYWLGFFQSTSVEDIFQPMSFRGFWSMFADDVFWPTSAQTIFLVDIS